MVIKCCDWGFEPFPHAMKECFLYFSIAGKMCEAILIQLCRKLLPQDKNVTHLFEEYLTRHRHATKIMEGSKLQNNHLAW